MHRIVLGDVGPHFATLNEFQQWKSVSGPVTSTACLIAIVTIPCNDSRRFSVGTCESDGPHVTITHGRPE